MPQVCVGLEHNNMNLDKLISKICKWRYTLLVNFHYFDWQGAEFASALVSWDGCFFLVLTSFFVKKQWMCIIAWNNFPFTAGEESLLRAIIWALRPGGVYPLAFPLGELLSKTRICSAYLLCASHMCAVCRIVLFSPHLQQSCTARCHVCPSFWDSAAPSGESRR